MASISFQDDGSVKLVVPEKLYKALVRVQADEDLGFEGACVRAAELIGENSEQRKKEIKREATRLKNSELMETLNKSRESIRKKAWEEGAEHVRENEDNFMVPCNKCGKPMTFSSTDSEWEKEEKILHTAFATWSHVKCG